MAGRGNVHVKQTYHHSSKLHLCAKPYIPSIHLSTITTISTCRMLTQSANVTIARIKLWLAKRIYLCVYRILTILTNIISIITITIIYPLHHTLGTYERESHMVKGVRIISMRNVSTFFPPPLRTTGQCNGYVWNLSRT